MVAESIVLIVAIILAVLVFLRFIPLNLWISALASGVHVSIFTLMGMRIRRVPPAKIVGPLIKAEKAGLNMQISKMEAHFLAGGNLDRVITALITARGANIKLDFPEACAIDLAGRDVLQAVQMSVNPKVIETPVVAAIAKDGIELSRQGARDRACEYRTAGRRRGRRDDRRACRRGHRDDRRLGGDAQGRARKPRSDQPHRAQQWALTRARRLKFFPSISRMVDVGRNIGARCKWIAEPTAAIAR